MSKRGYKLQEFVAHSGNVNCLRIGKKTCRVFVTGGDDQNVNLWSVGKPTPLTNLSGHTSPVESVAFDSTEVLVVAGASSGVIKLWDLEETKMVRTLTGHKSYCTAIEFHPFGEFFASGSMDTNVKVSDIRMKGCIHTYKGHSRAISTIRFSPDGRWVVSGGLDNTVKVWDLTAGKLLHDFKFHEGHIRSIDFHPLEFLLATGSADRTVKFWDLETFEMIGSARRESTGVRSITFHPDGRTLFSGMDASLKTYSWEPVICHDSIDMGWSTLADLCIHDGKLLGGAYYQNSVGVWAVDISHVEPYGAGLVSDQDRNSKDIYELKEAPSDRGGNQRSSDLNLRRMSPDTESDEIKNIYVDSENPVTSKKVRSLNLPEVIIPSDTKEIRSVPTPKHGSSIGLRAKRNGSVNNKSFVVPSIVPRESPDRKALPHSRRESITNAGNGVSTRRSRIRRASSGNIDMQRMSTAPDSGSFDMISKDNYIKKDLNTKTKVVMEDSSREPSKETHPDFTVIGENTGRTSSPTRPLDQRNCDEAPDCIKGMNPVKIVNGVAVVRGRTRSLVERFENREGLNDDNVKTTAKSDVPSKSKTEGLNDDSVEATAKSGVPSKSKTEAAQAPISEHTTNPREEPAENGGQEEPAENVGREEPAENGGHLIESLLHNHDILLSTFRSRLTKLQVVRHFWERNDFKGAINALRKLPDQSVQADVISVLMEKMEIITLDLFSCLLPVLLGLLDSKLERHVSVSLEMLLKLVAVFGSVVRSTVSSPPTVGVDLHAEERRECCKKSFAHLQNVQQILPAIMRRGGVLSRCSQELNLVLQQP